MAYPKDKLPRLVDAYNAAKAAGNMSRAKGIERFLNQRGFTFGKAGKLHDEKGEFTGH